MPSIEELLNGGGASAPNANPEPQAAEIEQPAPPEPETEPEPQATAEPATGEGEQSAPNAAPPAAQTEEPLDKRISAFQRKAEDETRKRQDYEKQLAETKRQLEEQAAYIRQVQEWTQSQQARQPEIDMYDPAQVQEYVGSLVARERQTIAQQLLEQKVVTSQEMMRSAHPDYQDYETVFATEMQRREANGDYTMRQQLNSHPFPAKYAYEQGKKLKLLEDIQDPDAYRQKVIEEYLASQQQQQPASQPVQTQRPAPPQPPKSLAGVPSASRDPVKQPWKGPTPLEQLLN